MASPRVFPGLLVPTAFQTMSLSNSTAVAVNSTVRNALSSILHISVETNAARYRADSTNPSLTTGILLPVGNYWIYGYNRTSNLKFQRQTGTCKVSIMAYKNLGD